MPNKSAILNASPFILLCKTDLLRIVPALFDDVVMPQAVQREILNAKRSDPAAETLPRIEWIRFVAVDLAPEVLSWDLGADETDVLSFALRYRAYCPILDDRAAKKCATALNLRTLGTGSLLILAKRHGLLESVAQALSALRANGLWISDTVMRALTQEAGE